MLDAGSGLGGASRFAADRYRCHVTGIDLTEEYVRTGQVMNSWVGLEHRVQLEGDTTELQKPDESFSKAYVMHVGMNISNKRKLAKELYRVLEPGGLLDIYDIMRTSDEEVTFPVPRASDRNGSALATVSEYKAALENAGFRITRERNRRNFAQTFFEGIKSMQKVNNGRPPLGLHIVTGENAALKLSNMIESIESERIAPTELFAEKPN